MGYCGFTFGCGCGIAFDFYYGHEARDVWDDLFTMIAAVVPGGEDYLTYTSDDEDWRATYERDEGQIRRSLTQHTDAQEFCFTVRAFEEFGEFSGRFEVSGVRIILPVWVVEWSHLVPQTTTWSTAPSPGPEGLDYSPHDFDDIVNDDAVWTTAGIGLYVPFWLENNPATAFDSRFFDHILIATPQQTGRGFAHPFGTQWMSCRPYDGVTDTVVFGRFNQSNHEVGDYPEQTWVVDTIVEVTEDGFEEHIGTAAAPYWAAIEYPGLDVDNLSCGELAAQVAAINSAEPIPRIAAIAPHSYPWVAAVIYPKIVFYAENRGCGDPDILWKVEAMQETAKIVIGPLIYGDETTPHRGPDGTGGEDVVIYSDTVANDRVIFREGMGEFGSGEGAYFTYPPSLVFPQCHLPSVCWFDRDPNTGDYGIIWSLCTRIMESDVGTGMSDAIPVEEVVSEAVSLKVTINGTLVFDRNVYWQFDVDDATGLIVCSVEESQGFTNSAVVWCERAFVDDVLPTESVPGTFEGWIVHVYDGDTEKWSLRSAGFTTPTVLQHSDRFFYVYNFQRVWNVDEGGDGESIYTNWVFSYQWNEEREAPEVCYPSSIAPTPGGIPQDRNSVASQRGIDSYKNTPLNALAPPFKVRKP